MYDAAAVPLRVVAAIVLGLLTALGCALFVLGLVALIGRQWKRALVLVASGFAASLLTTVALAWFAKGLMGGAYLADIGPESKARVLAESISVLMNSAALGIPAGVIAGALLAWRRRVKAGV